jgi:choline dehydrogenase-like flavoprotein
MRAVVVGSGVGGATAARELTRRGAEVVVVEAGRRFRPFSRRVGLAEPVRASGLLGTERNISRFVPAYRTHRSSEDLLLVRAMAVGGCSLVSCGCMVRAERAEGTRPDLSEEYGELERMMGVTRLPRERWRPLTRAMLMRRGNGARSLPHPRAVDLGSAWAAACARSAVHGRGGMPGVLEEAVGRGCRVRRGRR